MKKQLITGMVILLAALNGNAQELRATGLLESDEKLNAMSMVEKPLGFGANLPSSYSLEKYVASIGDQGQEGTCVGWATTYYAASIAYNVLATKNGFPTTNQWHYDPIYTYENIKEKNDKTCGEGSYIEDALVLLIEKGAKRKELDPARCGNVPSWFSSGMTLLNVKDAFYLYKKTDSRNAKIEAVCQMLSENKPVVIGMNLPKSFHFIGRDGEFKPAANEAASGGHAMCVVGYDDKKFGGAFRIVNSWGSSWGDNGSCWVKYDDFVKYVTMSYYFEYELGSSGTSGCIYGDCQSNYSVQLIAGKKGTQGVYEGIFSGGKMTKGIYYNNAKLGGKGGVGFMKKTMKKAGYGARLLYDGSDFKKPIGFILL
jgi:C1A family cysteine protease